MNRGGYNSTGPQLLIPNDSPYAAAGTQYFDCYHGEPLTPDNATTTTTTTTKTTTTTTKTTKTTTASEGNGSGVTISFDIEANGYGCVFAVAADAPAPPLLPQFLATMKQMTATALASYRKQWTFLQMHVVPADNSTATPQPRSGMKRCPSGV